MKVLDARTMVSMPLHGLKLIEASAGTGKTYAIANLYLRYVHEGWSVRQLLVVTFTNAATEELRGRLRARLYTAMQYLETLAAGDTPEDRDDFLDQLFSEVAADTEAYNAASLRLKLAVRSMDEAAIYTIHGFCQRALTDHAFNSNQSFDISLLSDDDDLWVQALKDWWRRQLYDASVAEGRLFLQANRSLGQFIRRQRPLRDSQHAKVIPQQNTLPPLSELHIRWKSLLGKLEDLAADWAQRHTHLRSVLETSKSLKRNPKNGYRLQELSPDLDKLHDWFQAGDFDYLPEVFHRLSEGRLQTECRKAVVDKGGDPAFSDQFFSKCQAISDKAIGIIEEFSLASLRDATEAGKHEVETQKQQQRVMAFSDQLNRLLAAVNGDRGDEQGEALVQNLRQAFPVAMIDEFQDTDQVQYRIFRRLYPCEPDSGTALIMIGDPKQAIYSFRGGDIFTYMQARRDAHDSLYTLNTNWRSVPGLIRAVNTLFENRENAFIYRDAIDFQPVEAAEKKHAPLRSDGQESVPMIIWKVPESGSNNGAWSIRDGDRLLHEAVAAEVVRLLRGGAEGQILLGDRPVLAGDIAVLVREKRQGTELREVLGRAGITAVTVSTDKVFQSEEATGLLRLLQGVVHCQAREKLRLALGSSLLAYDYREIASVIDDEARWTSWAGNMRELHELWAHKGFMVMFQKMMQSLDVAVRLAAHSGHGDAERGLTNVLHLAELLQQNAAIHPGMDALTIWFARQIQEASEEEAELRLESDENLVRIVTIHASKGLQYPIVFVPYLSCCRPVRSKDDVLRIHDEDKQACIDISTTQDEQHLALAEKERLAEDVRLLYVALTRAESRLYVAWGRIGTKSPTTSQTALAYLLYPDVSTISDLVGEAFYQPLQTLVQDSSGAIELQPLPESAGVDSVMSGTGDVARSLEPATFTGSIAVDWRITSFSALTRDVHQAPHGGSARGSDAIINFPAGSRVGLFLHAILEEADFTDLSEESLITLHRKHAARYGLDPAEREAVVIQWVRNIVNTQLADDVPPLATVDRSQRLDELPFDFSVARITESVLNRKLSRLASADNHGMVMPPLSLEAFRGLVTGIIDLVFEHEGRFFIADYKSNFLGGALTDYAPEQLDVAVLDRRYDLQYLLYTLALHRYLRQRLPDYDYTRHFGGVFYLFLRGMRPEHGPQYGVWYRKPDAAIIDETDEWMRHGDD